MDADVAADLRTINARIVRTANPAERALVDRAGQGRTLAVVTGKRGAWRARVTLPGGAVVDSPVYPLFVDAVEAAAAPHVAAVRGCAWEFPAVTVAGAP